MLICKRPRKLRLRRLLRLPLEGVATGFAPERDTYRLRFWSEFAMVLPVAVMLGGLGAV
jgi:hypothetical protein